MKKIFWILCFLCLVGAVSVNAHDFLNETVNMAGKVANMYGRVPGAVESSPAPLSSKGQIGVPIDVLKEIKTKRPSSYHPFNGTMSFIGLLDFSKMDDADTVSQAIVNGYYDNDTVFFQSREVLNQLLLYPKDLKDCLWYKDTVSFTIPESMLSSSFTSNSQGQPLMIYRGKGKFEHLCGMLQLDISEELLYGVSTLVIEVDSMHHVAGTFSVSLSSTDLRMTCLAPSRSMSIDMSGAGHVVYVPLPAGEYPELQILFLNDVDEEMGSYKFDNVAIERGSLTKLTIKSPPDPKSPCPWVRSKLQLGVDDAVTYDPSPISVDVLFSPGVLSLSNVRLFTLHLLPGQPIMTKSYFNNYGLSNKAKMDASGYFSSHFDQIELFPGFNKFFANSSVKRNCSPSYPQSVSSNTKKLRLYLKTKTDPFDYKLFARNDSLGGYVPQWNKPKWGAPITSVRWEFTPLYGSDIKSDIHTKWLDRSIQDDNHFKMALGKDLHFWSHCFVERDPYMIVVPGVLDFWAATVYKCPDPPQRHWEWSKEPCSFSTDIVAIDPNSERQSDGSVTFTGHLGISPETVSKLKGEKPIFKSSYFDGCERGFIVIDAETYQANDQLPEQIEKNKHVSNAKSGESFTCDISGLEENKTYYIWAYMQIDRDDLSHYLFVSRRSVYPTSAPANCIFDNIPNYYKESLPRLTALTQRYIDEYKDKAKRKKNKNSDMYDAFKELEDYYDQVNSSVGFKGIYKTEGETIPYTTEGNLSYTIVSSVRKDGIISTPHMFVPYKTFLITHPFAVVGMGLYLSCFDPVTLMDELPLFNIAVAKVHIRIDRIEKSDNSVVALFQAADSIEGDCFMPMAYVGEVGADGKRHSFVYSVPFSTKGLNVGDTVKVELVICGWGTIETLQNMRSLVFTDVDLMENVTKEQMNSLVIDSFTIGDALDPKNWNQLYGPK